MGEKKERRLQECGRLRGIGLALTGLIVAFAAIVGCTPASVSRMSVREARRVFSSEHYCPIHRVNVSRVLVLGVPPPAVERDPERFAMWRSARTGRAVAEERRVVRAWGCGEGATYSCWDFGGRVAGRRGWRRVAIGASCVEGSRPRFQK